MTEYLAAIDVGTNSVLLTVARRREDGELEVVEQRATVTRLGQGVDQSGSLHPEAEERTLLCLKEYRALINKHAQLRCAAVGTSALRDAQGGVDFVKRAEQLLGFPLEVISGDREAELTFNGAILGLSVSGRACVFDIGGGSTELIIGDADTGAIESSISLNLGSVRLTERLALSDPPNKEQGHRLKQEIEQQLAHFDLNNARGLPLIGVAGTVTTLAAISLGMAHYEADLIHGAVFKADELRLLSERLLYLSLTERLQLPGLSPGRADVIGAGAVLCATIVEQAGASELIVSDRGVRFGLLRLLADVAR